MLRNIYVILVDTFLKLFPNIMPQQKLYLRGRWRRSCGGGRKIFSVSHADHLRWTNTMERQPKSENGTKENFNSTIFDGEATKETHWATMPVFIAVFLIVLVLMTTTGNLVVCRLFWVCRRMRIPSFYFVVSMSFSDFLMGVLVIPMGLAYHMTFQTTGNKYDRL